MFLVIPEGADRLDDTSGHIVMDADDAVALLDGLAKDAAASGEPVAYRLFRLVDVPESAMWDWGVQRPGREVMVYVSERAARSCTHGGTLVRRRLGSDEWAPAEPVAVKEASDG